MPGFRRSCRFYCRHCCVSLAGNASALCCNILIVYPASSSDTPFSNLHFAVGLFYNIPLFVMHHSVLRTSMMTLFTPEGRVVTRIFRIIRNGRDAFAATGIVRSDVVSTCKAIPWGHYKSNATTRNCFDVITSSDIDLYDLQRRPDVGSWTLLPSLIEYV